jgi:hypothetical protein
MIGIQWCERDTGYEPEFRHGLSNRPIPRWIVRILDRYLNDGDVVDFFSEHHLEGDEDAVV